MYETVSIDEKGQLHRAHFGYVQASGQHPEN